MRNSTSGNTPKTNAVHDESALNIMEKSSEKKLKQARLPFKVITPGSSPIGTKSTEASSTTDKEKDILKDNVDLRNSHSKELLTIDGRKRKLSYDNDDTCDALEVNANVSKENVEILAVTTKKKKVSSGTNNETASDVIVSLLDGEDDDYDAGVENTSVIAIDKKELVLKNPKAIVKNKRKGAGTPPISSAQNKNGSASKLQIKLPLSTGKKYKLRKSKLQLSHNTSVVEDTCNNSTQELSSDDIEEVSLELNPHKRKKINIENENKKAETICEKEEIVTIASDSEEELEERQVQEQDQKKDGLKKFFCQMKKSATSGTVIRSTCKDEELKKQKLNEDAKSLEELSGKEIEKYPDEESTKVSNSSEEEKKEDLEESVQSDNDNEADDETDNLISKLINISPDISDDSKSKHNNIKESLKSGHYTSSSRKKLTSKQIKLMERRRKAREEKERKLQEEKIKKQQEKEEKELLKKREREEKEEQRRREREEKEEQKRKEREEKERKRLAEVEAKNEEKRRKNEAKEEELRKKEEERKRKEQEKEEAELKKKKAAQAFTKFFLAKGPTNIIKNDDDSNTGDGARLLAFRPFQVKGDMKLAPLFRKKFTLEERNRLDDLLGIGNTIEKEECDNDGEGVSFKDLSKVELYLSELRSGKIIPGKWRRHSTDSKDDVILVEDELERVGQAIVEDTPAYIREEMRVKFYKFHDNRRPPYYGTWRKKSSVVKPRRPFALDKKMFDYEVDSDDEWEEEEPGESLEDGSDDDKEKESEDDDYEVDNDWFVPHGHLSDEELQNEDENGMIADNSREAQIAKLQIMQQEFAQEMKKKTEKIKPRLIGCIWTDINGNQRQECPKILWDTLEKKAMIFRDPPLIEEPESDKSIEPSSPSCASNGNNEKITSDKVKPITLSDAMVKDLTRLIHGNNHSKNFLINEYIAYIEKTEESVKNGDLRKPLKSVIRDKIDEMAEWQVVDAIANDDVNTDITKKKKKCKRRLCWVVKPEMLEKMDLSYLELQNSWKYTLAPKFVKSDETTVTSINAENNAISTSVAIEENSKGQNASSQIIKFTKILTTEEKIKQLRDTPASSKHTSNTSGDKLDIERKVDHSTTSRPSKDKKRVPLLMSMARGQLTPTPTKNKLISQFLQQKGNNSIKSSSCSVTSTRRSDTVTSPIVEDDDIVILD